MCPTLLGRVETRTAVLVGPALLGALLSLLTGEEGFIVLIGLYLLIGVVLDLLFYPLVINWQPPWLTFVMGFSEFVILYVIAQVAKVGLEPVDAVWFYWLSWSLAQVTKIVVLPIVSLGWIENGGEFRFAGWTITPEQTPVSALGPVAPLTDAHAAPALVREFSTVGTVPAELRDLPPPSGVHRVPEELRRG